MLKYEVLKSETQTSQQHVQTIAPADLFQPWQDAQTILIAVSGGPDSMALLHLAAQWAQTRKRPSLHAATVDHGLRNEARAEIELVAKAAAQLGIPHQTLVWSGSKPTTGIQEKAREARYDLLATHAKNIGAHFIMTAHHADDQAETIVFRLLRGSGLTGLSGMKLNSPRGEITIARPLLNLRKADLIAYCQAQNQAFAQDASNTDASYARTRVRGLLSHLESQGLGAPDWTLLGKRLARADRALALTAQETLARVQIADTNGDYGYDFSALMREPDEIVLRVLAQVLLDAGGKSAFQLEKIEMLEEKLRQAAQSGVSCAATLSGLRVKLSQTGLLTLSPEGPRKRGIAK